MYITLSPNRPKRTFYGWNIVAASFLTNMLLAGVFYQGFQVFFIPLVNYFDTSRAALSGAFTLRQLETGLIGPVLGFVVDRADIRKIILIGGLVVGLGMIVMSQLTTLWMFYVILLISSAGSTGVSHGIVWPLVISRWFRRKRGQAIGIGTSGPVLSGLVIMAMTLIVQEFGWRWGLFVAGMSVCCITVPMSMVVAKSPEYYGLLPDGDALLGNETSSMNPQTQTANLRGQTAGAALRTIRFWMAFAFFAVLFFGTTGFQVHQVPYFESLGYTPAKAAFTVTIVLLMSGIGRIGSGILADFVDLRWILIGVCALNVLGWAYLSIVQVSNLFEATLFSAFFGISFGACIPLRAVVLSRLFGERALGSLIGLLQGGTLATGMVSPIFMGWIYDITGSYLVALQVFTLVTTVALPAAFFIRPSVNSEIANPD